MKSVTENHTPDMKLKQLSQLTANTTENTAYSRLRNNSIATESIIHPDDVGSTTVCDFAEKTTHKEPQSPVNIRYTSTPVMSVFNKAMSENQEGQNGERQKFDEPIFGSAN